MKKTAVFMMIALLALTMLAVGCKKEEAPAPEPAAEAPAVTEQPAEEPMTDTAMTEEGGAMTDTAMTDTVMAEEGDAMTDTAMTDTEGGQ